MCLWEFVPIQPAEQILMLDEKAVFQIVAVRALYRLLEILHINLIMPHIYGAGFICRETVVLEQKRAYPKLLPQGWKHIIV